MISPCAFEESTRHPRPARKHNVGFKTGFNGLMPQSLIRSRRPPTTWKTTCQPSSTTSQTVPPTPLLNPSMPSSKGFVLCFVASQTRSSSCFVLPNFTAKPGYPHQFACDPGDRGLDGIAQGVSLCFLKLAPKRQLVHGFHGFLLFVPMSRRSAEARFAPNSRHNARIGTNEKYSKPGFLSSNLV